MKLKTKFILLILIFVAVGAASLLFLFTSDIAVLNPKGLIAEKERRLLVIATFLMLIVVIPVFLLTFAIAWKYREDNHKSKYDPKWDHSWLAETIWWGIPCIIMAVLGVVTWKGCHELDPWRPLTSPVSPIHIQAVSLRWKWLFIYPEQGIATVNFVQFPVNTPVNFEITSDAPMNSFWIPQLGGQIYAMAGMRSKLHLIADTADEFRGSSANISGRGFSGMTFTAKSSSQDEFDAWVDSVRSSPLHLTLGEYSNLTKPTEYQPVSYYLLKQADLFEQILMKYMAPMP